MPVALKQRILAAKFQWACLREAGNVKDANALVTAAIRAQDNLVMVLAHADKGFVGDGFLADINHRIFSQDVPDSLSALFYRQSEIIHKTERKHYEVVTRDMPERIRAQLDEITPDLPTENKEALAETLLEQSLFMGDRIRDLAEALAALAGNLGDLSPYLQREAMKPHETLLLERDLLPAGFSFK